jgi:hypothetical protein
MSELLKRLNPEFLEQASDAEAALVLADLWSDVEFREVLFGTRDFIRERLLHYGRRGYFTARERQGILRVFFAPAVTIDARIATIIGHRPSD